MKFEYRAVSADGKMVRDVMQAESEADVLSWIYRHRLTPIEIKALKEKKALRTTPRLKRAFKVNAKDQFQFTAMMCNLLKSGFVVDQALAALRDIPDKSSRVHLLAGILHEALQEGRSLSQALKDSYWGFDELYISLIQAGEESGQLTMIFEELKTYLEHKRNFSKQIQHLLLYPSIVVVTSLVSLWVIFMFVIPRFESIFQDMGQHLPWLTQIMLLLSQTVRHWGWEVLGLVCASLVFAKMALRRMRVRTIKDRFILKLPLIGPLLKKMIFARFADSLGMLLYGGVDVLKSLNFARNTMGNVFLKQKMNAVLEDVRKGQSIARALKHTRIFPPLMLQMLLVGEQRGEMAESLTQVADTLDAEVQQEVKTFLALLGPGLIIGIGLIVGLVIAAMMLPLLQITNAL